MVIGKLLLPFIFLLNSKIVPIPKISNINDKNALNKIAYSHLIYTLSLVRVTIGWVVLGFRLGHK